MTSFGTPRSILYFESWSCINGRDEAVFSVVDFILDAAGVGSSSGNIMNQKEVSLVCRQTILLDSEVTLEGGREKGSKNNKKFQKRNMESQEEGG